MKNLYIITGPPGVGKSTISKRIAELGNKSVLIEGDDIYHQVIGGYVQAWIYGNHLSTFWKVCLNSIRIYLDDGYDVVFNYIIDPEQLEIIKESFKDYNVKFVVLLVDEETLLLRDSERPDDCQMNERCVVLLKSFNNKNYDNMYKLDTSDLTVDEAVKTIVNDDRFIV